MSNKSTLHRYVLIIAIVVFSFLLVYKLVAINSTDQPDVSKPSSEAEFLLDLKAYFYDGQPTSDEGFSATDRPLHSKEVRTEVFPRYLALRKTQLQSDWAQMEQTGKLPDDRKLGIDLSFSLLQQVKIKHQDLSSINFANANFVESNISNNIFVRALFDYADLRLADLSNSKVQGASFIGVDMSGANLTGIVWDDNTVFFMTNIQGVKNAPKGFIDHAMLHGALNLSRDKWILHIKVFKQSLLK